MQEKIINGIQQIGVGVDDVEKAFKWYGTILGADVKVFDDSNIATYMAPYMGGEAHKKRAVFALNLQGGGGLELWQYLDRKPSFPIEEPRLGDYGIFSIKIKTRNIDQTFKRLKTKGVQIISEIVNEPDDDSKSFYIKDPWNNILQISESSEWFQNGKIDVGGVSGCTVGVSDIYTSMKLYSDVLGFNIVCYDQTGIFDDYKTLPNGKGKFRRVLLTHRRRTGGFSQLFKFQYIELVQSLDDLNPKKIFADRYWGDIGFIHICFDIHNMNVLMDECAIGGFPFKVKSSENFDMGDANGSWGYLEDPDGTLIEFVETHKVPLVKKLNISINLTKRDPKKPLPEWLIKGLKFKRVRFRT